MSSRSLNEKRKDINGMCELCTEEVHFQTPKWETKNKKDLMARMKKEYTDSTKFYGETPLEEKPGRKISRTMKVKLMFGLITLKVQQTFRLNGDGLIKSMIAKKI